jgi:hypothetical protein
LQVSGNQVRIGINAPKHINIVREEIAGTPRGVKPRPSPLNPAKIQADTRTGAHSETYSEAHPENRQPGSSQPMRPRTGLYGRGR